jgi:Protein of unknown function (DUF1631)
VTDAHSDRFALFGDAREHLGQALRVAMARLMPSLINVLSRSSERALDLKSRVELQEAIVDLRKHQLAIPGLTVKRFNELVFKRLEIESQFPTDDLSGGLLGLLPDADLEVQIFSDDLATRIRVTGGEEYAAWVARVNYLSQQTVKEDRCSLGASIIAASIIQSLREICHERIVWAVIRPEIHAELPNDLAIAIADVNDQLRDAGVLPDLRRVIAKVETSAPTPPASIRKPANANVQASDSLSSAAQTSSAQPKFASGEQTEILSRAAQLVESALFTSKSLNKGSLVAAQTPSARMKNASGLAPIANLESEGVAFAHQWGEQPYSRLARTRFFEQLRQVLPAEHRSEPQLAVLDVVQALFDYAVDDRQVPEAAKPLLWRLQVPAVALSLIDASYLGEQPNSVRRMIENVSAIVMAFPDDVVRGSELHRRLEAAVRAVEIVAHTLQIRAGVLAEQIDRQFVESAKGVAMIAERVRAQRASLENMPEKRNRRDYGNRPNREIEATITQRLVEDLDRRIGETSAPESVKVFLREIWLRHMRTAALRNGQESGEFKVANQVVDDLLASLDTGEKRNARKNLAIQIPPLIKRITQGVNSVGVDEKQLRSFFDELFLIHLRRMQRQEVILPALESNQTSNNLRINLETNLAPAPTIPSTLMRGQLANAVVKPIASSTTPMSTPLLLAEAMQQRAQRAADMAEDANTRLKAQRIQEQLTQETQLRKAAAKINVPLSTLQDDPPVLKDAITLPAHMPTQPAPLPAARGLVWDDSHVIPEEMARVKKQAEQQTLQIKDRKLADTPQELIQRASGLPTIPSLQDMSFEQVRVPSRRERREASESASRSGEADKTRALMITQPGPVRIKGMDQVAAAASIRLHTQPMPDISLDIGGKNTAPRQAKPFDVKIDNALNPHREPQPNTVPDSQLANYPDASASERKLVELIDSVDVNDPVQSYVRDQIDPTKAYKMLAPGMWLELIDKNDEMSFAKLAWVNERHTLFLLVRQIDRKAVSLRGPDLMHRLANGSAFLLQPMRMGR